MESHVTLVAPSPTILWAFRTDPFSTKFRYTLPLVDTLALVVAADDAPVIRYAVQCVSVSISAAQYGAFVDVLYFNTYPLLVVAAKNTVDPTPFW